ncbi:MAG: alpha-ketoglutarate-dependent dioxygenase AlkB [Sphingomonas sp.]|jgi:alkylated DNA repair protein (DNA oxidative demethylase)|nr:MAG: alpha-ketoglutarate-dependent dioxygenase AlkB [Sphingomonas sp.]
MQPDLFAPAPDPLVATRADIVDPGEEAMLIAAIDATDPTPFRFQGWLGKRLTSSFGWSYDFDRGTMARGAPIPAFLLPLRERAAAFAGLLPDALEQALLIRYDPGAGIGWHRDRPQFEHVVGISLGAPATLRLRRRRDAGFDRATLPLVPRAAYHLTGEARHDWEHSVAPMDAPRWSVTFRSLSDRGRTAVANG